MEISVIVPHTTLKFEMYIPRTQMEGRVSQNVDVGTSFDFMKCRILKFWKMIKKLSDF